MNIQNSTNVNLLTAIDKMNNDNPSATPFFVYNILSNIIKSRKENDLNYFIRNINNDIFISCANGLAHTQKTDCLESLPPLIFKAIAPYIITNSRLNHKIINILLSNDKIDVNSQINRNTSNTKAIIHDDYDLLMMDGATPLDIVIEKTRNIPIAKALVLHGAKLKLAPSKSGLEFYKSIADPLYNTYKWLILSQFDPQNNFKSFPKEILAKIVQYQIQNDAHRFLPEDETFSVEPTPYLEALRNLKDKIVNDNVYYGIGTTSNNFYCIDEIRDLDLFFRKTASTPQYLNTLNFMLKNAKILGIDIHALNEKSENALDIAVKCNNQKAIKLLKEARIVANLTHASHSDESCTVQ